VVGLGQAGGHAAVLVEQLLLGRVEPQEAEAEIDGGDAQ
jgi:hypothetical protein